MTILRFAVIAALATACTSGTGDKSADTDTGADTDTDTTSDTDTDADTDADTDSTDVVDVAPKFNESAFTTDWTDFIDCGTNLEVSFEIELSNWGYDVEMYMAQTKFYGEFDGHEESHTLAEDTTLRSSDNDGTGFSVFKRTLVTGTALGALAPDVNTLWKCNSAPTLNPSDTDNFQVGWALAVWGEGADTSTDAPTDCIVFGTEVSELLTDADGNGRTPPTWLNSDCRDITAE